MKKPIILTVLALFLAANVAGAMSKEERIEDAQSIINLFTQQYGPLKWKEDNLGLNFIALANKLIDDADKATSDKDFYRAVIQFLSSFKDAHVSYKIPSSLVAYLPFDTEYFKDGVLIRWIDRKLLPKEYFPFSEGDQLMAMDGIPIENIIDTLVMYEENGYEPTNRKYVGNQYLTFRSQKKVVDVPYGPTTLTIRPKGSSVQKDVVLEWILEGDDVAEIPSKSAVSYMAKSMMSFDALAGIDPLTEFENSHYVDLIHNEQGKAFMDTIKPFFPVWSGFQQRMNSPFFTGTFGVGDKKIGFIRINTWSVDNISPFLDALSKELQYMNDNTDALVIDQTNNGGGSICYPFWVGSMFITEPKNIMKFQVRANRSHLTRIEDWYGQSRNEHKIHAQSWIAALRKSVESGDHLSAPISAYCSFTGEIFPYRNEKELLTLYIKPVLILINELDFSAADMFPVFMKEWGVARLFGSRTVGAGGNVVETNFVGNSELFIRITQSLMYRENEVLSENGVPTHYVENVGATPDFPYEMSTKDYYDGYESYRKAIDQAVLSLIENQ